MIEKKKEKKSRAELLIEEAVKAVERVEGHEHHIDEDSAAVAPKPRHDTGEQIARIDLQQFVDREAHLRLAADFENFRSRSLKEKVEAELVGREKILRGFLDILDNLDRAALQAESDTSPLADGLRMVLSQIGSWMKAEGLERINAQPGSAFDPNLHEAISQETDSAIKNGAIIREVRRGYKWKDRLLRAAAVIVNKRAEEEE